MGLNTPQEDRSRWEYLSHLSPRFEVHDCHAGPEGVRWLALVCVDCGEARLYRSGRSDEGAALTWAAGGRHKCRRRAPRPGEEPATIHADWSIRRALDGEQLRLFGEQLRLF